MKSTSQSYQTVLGIAPCKKGFGFAVFETRGLLVTWGVGRLYSRNDDEFLERVGAMLDKYHIGLVCLEDVQGPSRLGERRRRWIELAAMEARRRRVSYSRVTRSFAFQKLGLGTKARKYDAALRVIDLYPELVDVLPPPRRPWQTEDARLALFLAAALGAVHLPSLQSL